MQEQQTKRFANILLGLLLLGVIGFFSYGFFVSSKSQTTPVNTPSQANLTPTIMLTDYLSYQGKVGSNALDLLKEKASIDESASGLVTAINGRKANSSQHEYWAFYVNEKLAAVGPMQYQTKEGDFIEWKIEKY